MTKIALIAAISVAAAFFVGLGYGDRMATRRLRAEITEAHSAVAEARQSVVDHAQTLDTCREVIANFAKRDNEGR